MEKNEIALARSAYEGEERLRVYRVLVGKSEEGDQLGDPEVSGRIILRCIFRKWDVGLRTGSS